MPYRTEYLNRFWLSFTFIFLLLFFCLNCKPYMGTDCVAETWTSSGRVRLRPPDTANQRPLSQQLWFVHGVHLPSAWPVWWFKLFCIVCVKYKPYITHSPWSLGWKCQVILPTSAKVSSSLCTFGNPQSLGSILNTRACMSVLFVVVNFDWGEWYGQKIDVCTHKGWIELHIAEVKCESAISEKHLTLNFLSLHWFSISEIIVPMIHTGLTTHNH